MESKKAIRQQMREAPKFLKHMEIIQADSEDELIERITALLANATGITYTYSHFDFTFGISTITARPLCCGLNIYRNTGQYKRTRDTYSTAPPLAEDKPEFIIELDDLTRYFNNIFKYIVTNYAAETIAPFSAEDLNYGLYCPHYDDVDEDDDYYDELKEVQEEQERLYEEYCKANGHS